MTNKILIVDDDINILYGFRRRLRKHFAIHTVRNGDEALAALDAEGPFAVVVSDMRMPGMDGVRLLSEFRQRAPDTVRIMFTGHGDQETAVDAVNRGRISRFLAKPCSTEILKQALEEGLGEYQRKTRKREPEATDGLTGVFSRRTFLQAVEDEMKRARRFSRPMAIGLLAIDGFKDAVHGHGPGAGEGVLRGVAETVAGTLRGLDVIGRYGGEEFAILLVEADATKTRIATERIREAVAKNPVLHGRGAVRITVSIGVAVIGETDEDVADLIHRADDALDKAHQLGGDRVEADAGSRPPSGGAGR